MTESSDKPRGLWGVMGRASRDDAESAAGKDGAGEEQRDEPEPAEAAPDEAPAPPKGLWSVMGQQAAAVPAVDEEREAHSEHEQTTAAPPKGLWGVMAAAAARPADVEVDDGAASSSTHSPPVEIPRHDVPVDAAAQPADFVVDADATPAYRRLETKSGQSTKALFAAIVGLLSIPLAAIALLPDVWLRLPATIAGFAALLLGLLGWQEIRVSRGRQSGTELALAGMVLGVLGMFLGPILFAQVGQSYRKSYGRQQTIAGLENIGTAIDSYHREHRRFPAGGLFAPDEESRSQPMHGWMAALLPFLGEEELHGTIDFDAAYNAPINRPAMRRTVEAFLAAGGDRSAIGPHNFAPAHFAGLGGELKVEGIGLVKVGVFGPNSEATRDDVTDGLSQTFVAGEIAAFYPAWGEPENWRMIGRGLNRDPAGFGSAEGTGALFLKADGSVKFYRNDTDPEVLRMLSTPNAGDVLPARDW